MKKNPFAISNDDKIFITVKECGINPMYLIWDQIKWHYFGKSREPFILLDSCINWHEKELPSCPVKKLKRQTDFLNALKDSYKKILKSIETKDLQG